MSDITEDEQRLLNVQKLGICAGDVCEHGNCYHLDCQETGEEHNVQPESADGCRRPFLCYRDMPGLGPDVDDIDIQEDIQDDIRVEIIDLEQPQTTKQNQEDLFDTGLNKLWDYGRQSVESVFGNVLVNKHTATQTMSNRVERPKKPTFVPPPPPRPVETKIEIKTETKTPKPTGESDFEKTVDISKFMKLLEPLGFEKQLELICSPELRKIYTGVYYCWPSMYEGHGGSVWRARKWLVTEYTNKLPDDYQDRFIPVEQGIFRCRDDYVTWLGGLNRVKIPQAPPPPPPSQVASPVIQTSQTRTISRGGRTVQVVQPETVIIDQPTKKAAHIKNLLERATKL